MGRKHTFMDEAFRGRDYDPEDEGKFSRGVVFVIMAFSPDMDSAYSAIREACTALGLRARRVDDGPGSGIILREITEGIEDAEFIVCDLTHERPNVYYELGYAHGVGNESREILLIARAGATLHFDIAPLRVRYYESTEHLREIAQHNLGEMIRLTRRE